MDEVVIDMPSDTPKEDTTPPIKKSLESQSEVKLAIERNKLGQIVKGIAQDTNKNGTAGRPCLYCEDKENKQKIVDDYIKLHQQSTKNTIPWVEELALLLDISDVTLVNWTQKLDDNDELEHPDLVTAYAKLKSLQKLRLKQRAIGRFNPHGALYLLNADHKVIQTNKELHGNADGEPLKIIITEERQLEEKDE